MSPLEESIELGSGWSVDAPPEAPAPIGDSNIRATLTGGTLEEPEFTITECVAYRKERPLSTLAEKDPSIVALNRKAHEMATRKPVSIFVQEQSEWADDL